MEEKAVIMIKVSVVVPVYNAAAYLEECMNSLVQQTLREIEIICVNDGSTDDSLELLKKYQTKDSRIKIISKTNTGYGHTVNVGLETAAGKYIGIVEPDDFIRKTMYERLYQIAETLDLDMVKADFYQFHGEKNKKKLEYRHLSKNKSLYGKVWNPKENTDVFLLLMNTWTGIYKREFLNKHHIRHHESEGASFQDLGFWFQSFCFAKRVYFLNEPFYMYRSDNPKSSVHNREKVSAICREYEFMYSFLEQHPKLKKRYINIYSWKRFHDYQFALNRMGKEYRQEFVQRFRQDFIEAEKKGELSDAYFHRGDWRMLHQMMNTPQKFLSLFWWNNSWYKVRYYKEQYGTKETVVKVMKKLFGILPYGKKQGR